MKDGSNITTFVKKYHFLKDELKILKPLDEKRRSYLLSGDTTKAQETKKQIDYFVSKIIGDRIPLKKNRPYKFRFDIQNNWIKVKTANHLEPVTTSNYKDVLGWQ